MSWVSFQECVCLSSKPQCGSPDLWKVVKQRKKSKKNQSLDDKTPQNTCRALPRRGLRFYSSGWVQSWWNHPEQSVGLLWLSSFKCKANFWKETKPNAGWVPAKSGASLSLWKGQKQLKDTCLWVHFCPIRSWQWEPGRTREVMPWNKKFLIEREEKVISCWFCAAGFCFIRL